MFYIHNPSKLHKVYCLNFFSKYLIQVKYINFFFVSAWTWIEISVDYRNGLVRLDLDCNPSKFDSISFPGTQNKRVKIPEEAIVYFGQEPGRKKKYLVSIRIMNIIFYTGKLIYQPTY